MNNTLYNQKVKEHFLSPKNMGELTNPDGVGTIGNPRCGDVMKVMINVKDNKINDIKFQTFGCAAAIATSSAMTELAMGKELEKAKKISNKDVSDYLGGLPHIKMHCSNLSADALKRAIKDYENNKK